MSVEAVGGSPAASIAVSIGKHSTLQPHSSPGLLSDDTGDDDEVPMHPLLAILLIYGVLVGKLNCASTCACPSCTASPDHASASTMRTAAPDDLGTSSACLLAAAAQEEL
jgi:hypothetical protein